MRFLPRSPRPPGQPSSIRPPKSSGSSGAPREPGGTRPPGDSGRARRPRWLIGATICAAAVSLALAGTYAIRALVQSSSPAAITTARQTDSGCSASASLGTSEDLSRWEESWRMDSGASDWSESPDWDVFSRGNCLILSIPGEDSTEILRGYRITESGPVQLWEFQDSIYINEAYALLPWWGGRIPTHHGLLDPATGELSDLPWPSEGRDVQPIDEELTLVCDRSSSVSTDPPSCTAWEWNGGSPTERWTRIYMDYDQITPQLWYGVGGTSDEGSLVVDTGAENTVSFMSLADGSVRGQWSTSVEGQKSAAAYVPASDGWIRIDESRTQATVISADGNEGETFALSGVPDALLLVDGHEPTVAQFRRAYESGDTSWADTVLHCENLFECTLNGSPIALPKEVFSWQGVDDGAYQGRAMLSADKRTLLIRARRGIISTILLIDLKTGTAEVPANASAHHDRAVPRASQDLILTIEGSEVVGHIPVQ